MDKKSDRRLPFYIVIAFSLCLCNLVLREFMVNLENCPSCGDPQHLAEHGGVPDAAHIHDQEDDFVTLAQVNAPARIEFAREINAADLLAISQPQSPLLPPPKSA